MLKRLETTGFIKRQRRVTDERVVDISLTTEGGLLQQQAATIPEKLVCEIQLTFDDHSELLTRLKRLTAQLYSRANTEK
jgi:MarR family transcriptional regulator, organic hydroperoxide resistance regulator